MYIEVRHEFTSDGEVCLSFIEEDSPYKHQLCLESNEYGWYVAYYGFRHDILMNYERRHNIQNDIKNRIRQQKIFEEYAMSDWDPDYKYPDFEDKSLKELIQSEAYASDFKSHIIKAVQVAVIDAYTMAVGYGLDLSEANNVQNICVGNGLSRRYVSSSKSGNQELLVFIGRIMAYFESAYLGSTIRTGSLISNQCGFYDIKDHIYYTPEARQFANAARHVQFDGVYGFINWQATPGDVRVLKELSYDVRERWAVNLMKSLNYPGVIDYTNIIDYHIPEKQE